MVAAVQIQLIELVRVRASNDVAIAIVGWLTGKHSGQELTSMPTRARYRKILRELTADGITPDPATIGSAPAGQPRRGPGRRRCQAKVN